MVCRPLKGAQAFDYVMRSGRRVTSGPLLLSAIPHADRKSAPPLLRVGVTIGKRVAPSAVVRNRVKRLLRQAVRACVAKSAQAGITNVAAVVVIWRQRPVAPGLIRLAEVENHVDHALTKLFATMKLPL